VAGSGSLTVQNQLVFTGGTIGTTLLGSVNINVLESLLISGSSKKVLFAQTLTINGGVVTDDFEMVNNSNLINALSLQFQGNPTIFSSG
jgi:hypothetical protein